MGGDDHGLTVQPMRLKVLYTFDSENKTNCLTRWPHILDIQTAKLDEETQIGLIELRTCIQAIVSASPELVAKLGQDYTVYAYDYTEYETPLVGQGMLSWVLANSSPTPDAPAHQSKTIVTGRVCKNVLGLFSKGAQETLEVKLRLVPVPTVLQGQYLSNMQRYREMSSSAPQDLNTSSFNALLQASTSQMAGNNTPLSADRVSSPVDRAGIERMHEILSECSTPRDFSCMQSAEPFRVPSPAHSQATYAPPSRMSTPGLMRPDNQQHQRSGSENFRPSSRASSHDLVLQPPIVTYLGRRGSMQSGYGTCDEGPDQPPRKRAKVFTADWQGKSDMNIEKQPGSLRVAASTAASVRIHRPTPVNPATIQQGSNEEPARPPTPIPRLTNEMNRRGRLAQSSLHRESSSQLSASQTASYQSTEDQPARETSVTSPEDVRYGSMSETPFHMPSSPPVMDSGYPQPSSPGLPSFNDHDSGFMSGGIDCFLDDNNNPHHKGIRIAADSRVEKESGNVQGGQVRETREESPANRPRVTNRHHNYMPSDGFPEPSAHDNAPQLPPPARKKSTASRPSSRPPSRASTKPAVKPIAPAAISQSELDQIMRANPPSDPSFPHPQQWSGPMSDLPIASTPAPMPAPSSDTKVRSGAGARRTKQVQARLDSCIREGRVPPYCENCGAIETPTWRRAWSKVLDGSAEDAEVHTKDSTMLFWESVQKDEDGKVTVFKLVKKSLRDEDKDFDLVLLCNPCGLWLHKTKMMRPENKWNKTKDKRKRKSRARGVLPPLGAATRSQRKAQMAPKRTESSPAPTDASSPADGDSVTPEKRNGDDAENDDASQPPSKKRRANSMEPRKSTDTAQSRWEGNNANEALRRAIQSSPARNAASRNEHSAEANLTPKPVNRLLFPTPNKSAMKSIGDSVVNTIRQSPRSTSTRSPETALGKENLPPGSPRNDNLDHLFNDDGTHAGLEPPSSPTPKRRVAPPGLAATARPSNLASISTSPAERESGLTFQSEADQPTSPTRSRAAELERPELLGTTVDEYRIRNLMGSHDSPTRSVQNAASRQNYEVIDGIVMDMFDTDDEASVAQTESNYSALAPKGPSSTSLGNWIGRKEASPGHNEEVQGEQKKRTDHDAGLFGIDPNSPGVGNPENISGDSLDQFFANNSDLMDPDKGFRPIIFEDSTAQPNAANSSHDEFHQSILPHLDFFDPDLVDPALMDLGGQEEGTGGRKNSSGIDHATLSALLQEVNSQNPSASSG